MLPPGTLNLSNGRWLLVMQHPHSPHPLATQTRPQVLRLLLPPGPSEPLCLPIPSCPPPTWGPLPCRPCSRRQGQCHPFLQGFQRAQPSRSHVLMERECRQLTEVSQSGGCRVSRQQCGLWGQADLNLSYSVATPWLCPLASASSSVDGIVIAPSSLVVCD